MAIFLAVRILMRSEQHSVAILRSVAIRGYFPAWLFFRGYSLLFLIFAWLSVAIFRGYVLGELRAFCNKMHAQYHVQQKIQQ